jgi:hypothetical protein
MDKSVQARMMAQMPESLAPTLGLVSNGTEYPVQVSRSRKSGAIQGLAMNQILRISIGRGALGMKS